MSLQRSLSICLSLVGLVASVASANEEGIAFFESKVRPVLVKHCYECHSHESAKLQGGLALDSKTSWEKGGDTGPALTPGQPDKSLLMQAVRYEDENLQMPPKSKLAADEIQSLERWIAMGAPDPRLEVVEVATVKRVIDIESARNGWAYRPLQKHPLPAIKRGDWVRNDIDVFISADLESEELMPAADADPMTLIRRLSYDLTGLPPTIEDVVAFSAASRTLDSTKQIDATQALVDRLIASPAFGEKWGRHWLDLVRYADSNGGDRNYTFYQAWRYRNYVIDAFNRDKSYYEFVREQIAGDLLSDKNDAKRSEQIIASTFLALGPKMLTERDKEKLQLDTVDEQLDTIGKAFLALSIGCARCHDHKFDPITQRDYYALAGILRGTEVVMGTRNGCVNVASWVERALPGEREEELNQKLARLELTMRLKVERDFMKKASGEKLLEKLPLAGVIYDEMEAEFIGQWKQSKLASNRFGDFYMHDERKNKGEKKAIFRGSLPETGVYEVRIAYPAKSNLDRHVPVTIEAIDGIHKIILDQTQKPNVAGLFEPVGRFSFEKGRAAIVTISTTDTEDYVTVDAVQFISEKDIDREATALAMASGKSQGDQLLTMDSSSLAKELDKQLAELKNADLAMSPRDFVDADDIHLRVRGEIGQLGPKVPRGFPGVLFNGPAPIIPAGSSGRLELATWITNPDNAILDRVIVNRLWKHLFGRGVVATVDDFGVQGQAPSHPAMLDFLAAKFRASGGSMKSLIREMVLSRTYQLASEGPSPLMIADPENRLFGRHSYRRLTAEEIRDSLLFLSLELEPGPSAVTASKFGEDLDKPMKLAEFKHRSVYIPVARNNVAPELEIFDVANPEMTTGERALTTVPTQSLFLLNSPFVIEQASNLAKQAYTQPKPIDWLHERILGRASSPSTLRRAAAFVEASGEDRQQALADLAHVLFASTEFLFVE